MKLQISKTFLMDRNKERLLFRKEASPVAKFVVLLLAGGCFVLSMKAPWAATTIFKTAVIIFAALALAVIGAKKDLLFVRSESELQLTTNFFFYKKTLFIPYGEIESVIEETEDSLAILAADKKISISSHETREVIGNWKQAIEGALESPSSVIS